MRATLLSIAAAALFAPSMLMAQTLNWASPFNSSIVDSEGATLDSSFTFELGVFNPSFTPLESNVDQWASNWLALDQADYDPALGYFTASLFLQGVPDYATLYAERQAYLWVRNSNSAIAGSEWFLASAPSWVLPPLDPDCCGNDLPVEWSVSDLGSDVPEYGSQNGVEGPGVIVNSGTFTLQTATFIPEPSSALLIGLAVFGLVGRRRRTA